MIHQFQCMLYLDTLMFTDDEVLLNVLRCQFSGTSCDQCRSTFNNSLRPRKPEGSLGRTAQDVHLDSHTAAPELWWCLLWRICIASLILKQNVGLSVSVAHDGNEYESALSFFLLFLIYFLQSMHIPPPPPPPPLPIMKTTTVNIQAQKFNKHSYPKGSPESYAGLSWSHTKTCTFVFSEEESSRQMTQRKQNSSMRVRGKT